MAKTTIEDIKATNKDFLSPAQVADVLGWDAQYIRITAQKHKEKLPFPVLTHNRRTQIPKGGFLEWWEREVEHKHDN